MRLCGKLGLGGLLVLLLLTSPDGVAGDQEGEPAAPQSAAEMEAERSYGLGLASYQRYCRTCHGSKGKGDGKIVEWLKVPPTDLTRLSAENEGVFPEARVRRAIDGREEVKLHGDREMPIWGEVLQVDTEGRDPENPAQTKIEALIRYLRHIQEPGPEG